MTVRIKSQHEYEQAFIDTHCWRLLTNVELSELWNTANIIWSGAVCDKCNTVLVQSWREPEYIYAFSYRDCIGKTCSQIILENIMI